MRGRHRGDLSRDGPAATAERGRQFATIKELLTGGVRGFVNAALKPPVAPSNKEVLAGLVERVTFHNAENGFCILRIKARGHREIATVGGHAAAIYAGE